MPRTPLMHLLRKAVRKAAQEKHLVSEDRRRFLQTSLAAGAGLAVPSLITACADPQKTMPGGGPRVVIIGAGIGGLAAAHTLRKAGIKAEIYEATSRTGGRIMTARDLLFPGTVTELGAELIDSDDAEIQRLAQDLDLQLLDLHTPAMQALHETFFFDGHHYTEADIVREIGPVLEHMSMEVQGAQGTRADGTQAPYQSFDEMSIEAYFAHLGLTGWLRAFLESAYVSENGLELGEQSAQNFTSSVGLDVSNGTFSLFGQSDERYKIAGGNQQLTDRLAEHNAGSLHKSHVLEAVRHLGNVYAVSLRQGDRVFDIPADFLILAIPFTLLREVELHVPVPPIVNKMITELRYGNNSKVVVAFERPFWHDQRANGTIYADEPIQLTWDNTAGQGAQGGGLTFFSGGTNCRMLGGMTREASGSYLLGQLAHIWPEAAVVRTSKLHRMHWPSMPWARASYSSFGPGQWTQFAGLLQQGFSNNTLQFAGEHCSDADRGFMNGAATTGRQAAERVLQSLGQRAAHPKRRS
jgi:monoamine oxidase